MIIGLFLYFVVEYYSVLARAKTNLRFEPKVENSQVRPCVTLTVTGT